MEERNTKGGLKYPKRAGEIGRANPHWILGSCDRIAELEMKLEKAEAATKEKQLEILVKIIDSQGKFYYDRFTEKKDLKDAFASNVIEGILQKFIVSCAMKGLELPDYDKE